MWCWHLASKLISQFTAQKCLQWNSCHMVNWSTFLHQNLKGGGWSAPLWGGSDSELATLWECFIIPCLHTVGHAAFLSWRICRDEEVIAVSTLRLPWRQRGFHSRALFPSDPVFFFCLSSWHWSPPRALRAPLLCLLPSHWIQLIDVQFEWEQCVSWASSQHTASGSSAEETRTFGQHRSVECLCAFSILYCRWW